MIQNMKTILSAVKQYVEKGLKKSIPDWNENNPGSINYIKNRPFYEKDNRTTIYLNETIIDGFSESDNLYRACLDEYINLDDRVVSGETYTVSWDGVEYSATLQQDEGCLYFGINYYYPGENPDNLPFGILLDYKWDSETEKIYATKIMCVYTNLSMSASHTIAIHRGSLIIKKLDEKYLPDSVVQSEVVVVTRKEDDRERATHTSREIYDLCNEGKYVIFVDGDMTYYLTYSEVDPIVESTFVSIWGNHLWIIRVSGNGSITEENLDIGSIEDIDLKMDKTNPVGTGSFSMNRKANTIIGINSHAEGSQITASGKYSHAEGNNTVASGDFGAHAEGLYTIASGDYGSHAEGYYTTASGDYSHAEGNNTTAQRKSQHVQGEYNILDTGGSTSTRGKYIHIVGNGTSTSARSNAHTLDWNGLGWFAGGLKIGGTGQDDETAKTVATLDDLAAISIEGVASWNDLNDKPFYEEGDVEILPETEMVFDTDGFVASASIDFKENETYTVVYNGTEYTAKTSLQNYGGIMGVAFGNLAAIGGNDTGEPFLLGYLDSMGMLLLIPLDSPSTVSISIAKPPTIHKLDSKFVDLDWLVSNEKELLPLTEFTTQSNELPITFDELIKYKTAIVHYDGVRYTFPIVHNHIEGDSDCGIWLKPSTNEFGVLAPCNTKLSARVLFVTGGTHTLSISVLDEDGGKKVNMNMLPIDSITEKVIEALPVWNGGAY